MLDVDVLVDYNEILDGFLAHLLVLLFGHFESRLQLVDVLHLLCYALLHLGDFILELALDSVGRDI